MFSFTNRRARDRRRGTPQPHPLLSSAISKLPAHTQWAAACSGEFRVDGVGDLRGILHHDGAILRFTTWGGAERFVGSPMEFAWDRATPSTFHIVGRDHHWRFTVLGPLSDVVPDPPGFASEGREIEEELDGWMRTWAPERRAPLASAV